MFIWRPQLSSVKLAHLNQMENSVLWSLTFDGVLCSSIEFLLHTFAAVLLGAESWVWSPGLTPGSQLQ